MAVPCNKEIAIQVLFPNLAKVRLGNCNIFHCKN